MSSAKGIWVLAEHKQGRLENISLQLVSEGRGLADKLGENVQVIIFGSEDRQLADTLGSYGTDKVYFINSPALSDYSAESAEFYVKALSKIFEDEEARIVLCGATLIGRDFAPRLAARLKTGLVSDCVALEIDTKGHFLLTKPTYGGKVYTKLACRTAGPQLVTVKADVLEIKKPGFVRKPTIIPITPQFVSGEPRIRTTGFIKGDPRVIDIEEAEIIVAAGRGVGDTRNFLLLEDLAAVLGASVAASLPAVDAGWVSSERQVGLTGKIVAPRLYIACGISGAHYHTQGMKDSEVIIAINTDRHAPIFQLADVGIVGNISEVVPAITNRLRGIVKSDAEMSANKISNALDAL